MKNTFISFGCRFTILLLLTISLSNNTNAQNITTVAGQGGKGYNSDGIAATTAELNGPTGICFDASGSIIFLDRYNYRVRKISSSGIISTVAGTGTIGYTGDGGPATAALIYAISIAVDGSGNIVMAGQGVIRKVNTSGIMTTIAGNGTPGYAGDGGPATAARLDASLGMVFDASGSLIFTDVSNNRIRKINASGVITTIAGTGTAGFSGDGGSATAAKLNCPSGMTIDGSGNLYFIDRNNFRIRKITASGTISTIGGNGSNGFGGDGGAATAAMIQSTSSGMTIDAGGNICFGDCNRVREINSSGIISTVLGSWTLGYNGDGIAATAATFYQPNDVKFDAAGNMYISDELNARIRKVNSSGIISTIAGIGHPGFSGDGGIATAAQLFHPKNVAVAANGDMYIADNYNHRIRKVTASGIISTIAGRTGYGGYSGDGGPATAADLDYPHTIGIDGSGNIYIADNAGPRIRKISTSGIISTIAGGATTGFSGDGGPATAAMLGSAFGFAFDRYGNVFFTDAVNQRIRKIDASGIITTIAGNGSSGFSGDGGAATAAALNNPHGIAIDSSGNLYVADASNQRIRKITTSGIISTFAGSSGGFSGDGGAATSAQLSLPIDVATDTAGNVYIVDYFNNRIRKVNAAGIISTVGGTGIWGYTGDGGAATAARFFALAGIATDRHGNVYIADDENNAIRKIINCATPTVAGITGSSTVCAGNVITLTDTTSGGTWSSTNTSIASVNPSTGIVTGVAAGSSTIMYIVTNICGSDSAMHNITVNPLPEAGSITGTTAVCIGSTIALTDTTTGGAWSSANPSIASVNPSTGVVTGVAAGSTTLMYVVTNSCGSDTAIQTLTVNPLPDAGTITGIDSVCPGATATLATGSTGGIWSSSNTTIASVNSATGVVTGVSFGSATISYIVTNLCGSDTATYAFQVRKLADCPDEVGSQQLTVSSLWVYPNPNSGSFTIILSSSVNEDAQVTISNILGQKVKDFVMGTNKDTEVSLDVSPGIYFVAVVANGGITTTKIVVE